MRRACLILLAVLLALTCLSGCESVQEAVLSSVFPTDAPTARPTPVPTPEPDPTPTAIPFSTTQQGLHSDLKGSEVVSYRTVSGPVNGYFWLQRNGSDVFSLTSALSAFNLDGRFGFTTDLLVCTEADFNEDGQTLVVVGEGKYSRRGDGAYRIEQLDRATDLILDFSGKTLYTTASQDEWDEEILCHGEGRFITIRRGWRDGEEVWYLGSLDAHGQELDPFLPIEETGLPESVSPESITKVYDLFSTALTPHRDPVCLGEGWYVLPGAVQGLLYRPETGEVRSFDIQRVLAPLDGGRFFGMQYGRICVCDLEDGSVTVLEEDRDLHFAGPYRIHGLQLTGPQGNTLFDLTGSGYTVLLPTDRADRIAAQDDAGQWFLLDLAGDPVGKLLTKGLDLLAADWISENWVAAEGHLSSVSWGEAE